MKFAASSSRRPSPQPLAERLERYCCLDSVLVDHSNECYPKLLWFLMHEEDVRMGWVLQRLGTEQMNCEIGEQRI